MPARCQAGSPVPFLHNSPSAETFPPPHALSSPARAPSTNNSVRAAGAPRPLPVPRCPLPAPRGSHRRCRSCPAGDSPVLTAGPTCTAPSGSGSAGATCSRLLRGAKGDDGPSAPGGVRGRAEPGGPARPAPHSPPFPSDGRRAEPPHLAPRSRRSGRCRCRRLSAAPAAASCCGRGPSSPPAAGRGAEREPRPWDGNGELERGPGTAGRPVSSRAPGGLCRAALRPPAGAAAPAERRRLRAKVRGGGGRGGPTGTLPPLGPNSRDAGQSRPGSTAPYSELRLLGSLQSAEPSGDSPPPAGSGVLPRSSWLSGPSSRGLVQAPAGLPQLHLRFVSETLFLRRLLPNRAASALQPAVSVPRAPAEALPGRAVLGAAPEKEPCDAQGLQGKKPLGVTQNRENGAFQDLRILMKMFLFQNKAYVEACDL